MSAAHVDRPPARLRRRALLCALPLVLCAASACVGAPPDGARAPGDAPPGHAPPDELDRLQDRLRTEAGRAVGAGAFRAHYDTVDAFARDRIELRARLDPEWATRAGVHDADDRLTRYDDASWAERGGLLVAEAACLQRLLAQELSPSERVDALMLMSSVLVDLHERARRDARTVSPDLPLGAVSAVNDLLVGDFAPREVRVRCAAARLAALPEVCADARAVLARPPELWTRMAIDDTRGALAFLDEVPSMAGADLPPALQDDLAAALHAARAALEEHAAFLVTEVLPRSDGAFAAGRADFEYRLRVGYLLDLDAEELLAFGEAQFADTVAELERAAERIDPARGWRDLLAEMMEDHPSAESLMQEYRDEIARSRAYLVEHDVVPLPDETLQLRETPAFLRSTVPFAAYHAPAPLDASRLGTFYVTPVPEAHIRSDIPGTTWHEAYPGHHLQLVYANDNPSLVRRLDDSPLLSEGWGLYCEELAAETGYYDDPEERLMQLNWKLQRAARVILDTSLHAFGMPYEDAVTFLVDEVGMRRAQAEASVNAYTQRPTYFSSYLLGMREIVRMREACRARLGDRFTLRAFHERLLRCGNVPPALAAAELERTWR